MPKAPSHLASPSKTRASHPSSNSAPSQASHTHPTPYNRPEAPSHNNNSQGKNNNRTATAPTTVSTATRPTTTTSATTRSSATISRPATITKTTPGVGASIPPDTQINSQQSFTAFLERIKYGKERTYPRKTGTHPPYEDLIRIPDQFLFTPRPSPSGRYLTGEEVRRQFLLEIFPDIQTAPVKSEAMMSNVILTEGDDDARMFNEETLELQKHLSTAQARERSSVVKEGRNGNQVFGYQERDYTAISEPLRMEDYEMQDMVTAHWLNPPGMPPHQITLRLGHPVILIKYLHPYPEGTRMIVTHLGDLSIIAEISIGPFKGQTVTLPRMPFTSPNAQDIGIMFTRTQLPIKHAFALSLRDAVGSTVPGLVVLDLKRHVSGHRMLYFLMACCADYRNLRVYVGDGEIPGLPGKYTSNPI